MAGYASRTAPAEGALHPLWAKALVFEDPAGQKLAILTTDLIGLSGENVEAVRERIHARTGIPRENLLINFSHTHCGPWTYGVCNLTYGSAPDEYRAAALEYTRHLQDKLADVVQQASHDLQPAKLAFGRGEAKFAGNRRLRRGNAIVNSQNPDGPVDHGVPVLRVTDGKGRLRAVLFGYACHSTSSSAQQYNGDYAGFAQIALEKAHPGATAMFMIGCGGDSNPYPRGTVELSERHGRALAKAVDRALEGQLVPVEGPLRVAFARVDLPFVAPPTRDELLTRRGKGSVYQQRLTEALIKQLDDGGSIEKSYPCPLQVVCFGDDLTMIGLSGETVVDYALRLRQDFPGRQLWVAGYCNDLFGYLPSQRVLDEGGYEGGDAMVYFGRHGPFQPGVEQRVMSTVKQLVSHCEQATQSGPAGKEKRWTADENDLTLWYEQPAKKWTEAMPMGNGRMAAMVYGGTASERLALNEESLWAGLPNDVYPENFAQNVRKVQQLILAGKISEARALGLKTLTKKPTSFRSFQPFADLWIDFQQPGKVEGYRRELDLATGMARITYRAGDARVCREVLLSAVDDVVAMRLSIDGPGKLRAKVRLTREKDITVLAAGDNRLNLNGQIVDVAAPDAFDDNKGGSGPGGKHMKFAGRLLIKAAKGTVRADGNALVIDGADEAILLFTGTTDYNLDKMNFDRAIDPGRKADTILEKAARKSWDELKRDHLAEYRGVFGRVSLRLADAKQSDSKKSSLPTDKRLQVFRKDKKDPGLAAQVFQFGRYLLMSSSRRPGVLPANLQGIWNDRMWAPWEADYHLNINLQMNYWPSDLCNVPGSMGPLAGWLTRLSEKGTISAKRLYDTQGWVCYLATNPFGRTTPSASTIESQFVNASLDPLAGAWMAMTLWRHYEFTQDRKFLDKQAYPVLKGASQFLLDYMVEDSNGKLVIVPSTSPENTYIHPKTGKAVRITCGSTYHTSIVRAVFQAVIDASRILGRDQELRQQLEQAMAKLPPITVGKDGTIREWIEDYKEKEPKHRHVSHLIGLYPFAQITESDHELLEAARKTLDRRGFGGDVGWSNAWKSCFFARLKDSKQAHWYMDRLISRNMFPNMLSCYNGRIFQIDCNFGASAAVAEMLLQSHGGSGGRGRIDLLPALPDEWSDGKVTGLRARGGFEVDIEWSGGKLVQARIKPSRDGTCEIRYDGRSMKVNAKAGRTVILDGNLITEASR